MCEWTRIGWWATGGWKNGWNIVSHISPSFSACFCFSLSLSLTLPLRLLCSCVRTELAITSTSISICPCKQTIVDTSHIDCRQRERKRRRGRRRFRTRTDLCPWTYFLKKSICACKRPKKKRERNAIQYCLDYDSVQHHQ